MPKAKKVDDTKNDVKSRVRKELDAMKKANPTKYKQAKPVIKQK